MPCSRSCSCGPTSDRSDATPIRPVQDSTVRVRCLAGRAARCWKRDVSEGASFYFLDPDGHRLELHEGDLDSRLAAVDRAPYAGWVRFERVPTRSRPRLAQPADVAMIEHCARLAYARYIPRMGREPAPMRTDAAAVIAQERVRVIEQDGRVAGYAMVERRAAELHLESVAVLPELAGRGLGRALIGAVEEEARWLGLDRVTLYTHVAMHENLALYARLGYVETGRRTEHGFDRVFLEKRVSSGNGAVPV